VPLHDDALRDVETQTGTLACALGRVVDEIGPHLVELAGVRPDLGDIGAVIPYYCAGNRPLRRLLTGARLTGTLRSHG
jgi:hypothetical protein